VLRLIVGDEASTIRKLTAWRKVAETWGGATQGAVDIRCGDAVRSISKIRNRYAHLSRIVSISLQ
jgi:hypothetical protein